MAAAMRRVSLLVILLYSLNYRVAAEYTNCSELGDLYFNSRELGNLTPGGTVSVEKENGTKTVLYLSCYSGVKQSLAYVFSSASFRITIKGYYDLYKGNSSYHICKELQNNQWSFSFFNVYKTGHVYVPPFKKTCLGILTDETAFTMDVKVKVIDPWLLLCIFAGFILFYSADKLSRNVLFYYGSGVSIGMIASILILFFIISKFVPRKNAIFYTFLLGGTSIFLWSASFVWYHMQSILEDYQQFVIAYFVTAGVISFSVCYYKGPEIGDRTRDLITWLICGVGLTLVYCGTQIMEVFVSLIVLMVTWPIMKKLVLFLYHNVWRRFFPKQIRLLTEAEFLEQADVYTRTELDELKKFCKSPKCDAWKTVGSLTNPQRFASWIDGDTPHMSDEEILDYDSDPTPDLLTDDEDDASEISFRLNSP